MCCRGCPFFVHFCNLADFILQKYHPETNTFAEDADEDTVSTCQPSVDQELGMLSITSNLGVSADMTQRNESVRLFAPELLEESSDWDPAGYSVRPLSQSEKMVRERWPYVASSSLIAVPG